MIKKTIMIADDDRDFLKIEEQFLRHAGYNVLCATDGYRALDLAVNHSPQLLILDVNMPAGDGMSVHLRMKRSQNFHSTPVIYVTGQQSEKMRIDAQRLGAFAVMTKPFEFEVLLTTIKAALGETGRLDLSAEPQFNTHTLWAVPARHN